MPLVKRSHRPIHLADGARGGTVVLRTSTAQRTLTVRLDDGEVLSARSEHVRPVQGTVRSRLLYDWSSPFIAFAAGLYGLSRVTGDGVPRLRRSRRRTTPTRTSCGSTSRITRAW